MSNLYLGANAVSFKLGATTPNKVYLGTTLIHPAGSWSPSDLGAALALWLDADDADTISLNGSSISEWQDKSGNNYHAAQSIAADQPTYPAEQDRVIFSGSDRLLTTLPATTGTLVLGTTNGTAAYAVNIPTGNYDIGRRGGLYMPDGTAYGYILSNTAMSQADIDAAISYLRDKGAGQNYGNVTNFTAYWRGWSELTSFPLIDTSAGKNFNAAWLNCTSLTSFPQIDTSAGTNFQGAWQNCASLTSFPLINTSAGTNFDAAWYGCSSLTSFPLINTSAGTNFAFAWFGCSGLTSFPLINTSAGTNFQGAWQNCTSLTSFPLIDTSAGTNFQGAWQNCASLTSFPLINTSAGTNFDAAWFGCSSLTSFPLIDTSAGTNFFVAWFGCSSLTSFPLIDTSAGTNFQGAWQNCASLTSFPLIDTSAGTNFQGAWQNCTSLTSFPLINTSAGTNFDAAWFGCSSLTSFPLIDTSAGTNFFVAWFGCSSLTSFPLIDTSAGTNFQGAWQNCTSLTSFPLIDTSAGTEFRFAWYNCNSLASFPANFFDNCPANNFNNAFSNTNLSQESIDNILVSIESNNTSNGTFNQSGGSAPSAVGEAAIDALVARGWTVTVTGGYQPSLAWSPSNLGAALALWLDADDTDTVTLNGSSISQWNDKSGNDYHAAQAIAADQPTYPAEQDRVIFSGSDRLLTTLPATTGTLVLGTTNGTAAYAVNIPTGNYDIGRRGGLYMPDGTAYGYILSNTAMSQADIDAAISYLRDKGAGQNYGGVSAFTGYWQNWAEITSFPLIDTSNGTDFQNAWQNCSGLTSFPLIDTSSGEVFGAAWFGCSNLTSFPLLNVNSATNFGNAWRACSSLANFPANFFNNCQATNFSRAFTSTALSQQSIDNILVSIESNGTSNGAFDQSGGSAPSTVGQAAITALRNRGWTVAVTGGF